MSIIMCKCERTDLFDRNSYLINHFHCWDEIQISDCDLLLTKSDAWIVDYTFKVDCLFFNINYMAASITNLSCLFIF